MTTEHELTAAAYQRTARFTAEAIEWLADRLEEYPALVKVAERSYAMSDAFRTMVDDIVAGAIHVDMTPRDALPPPTPMRCDHCGEPVAFDPYHRVLAHPRDRQYAAWCCHTLNAENHTTVAAVGGARRYSDVAA